MKSLNNNNNNKNNNNNYNKNSSGGFKNNKKPATNTEILQRGLRISQKKQKQKKEQIQEISWDPENRRDYLTGFRKRKVRLFSIAFDYHK
jgi:hypothetical protein